MFGFIKKRKQKKLQESTNTDIQTTTESAENIVELQSPEKPPEKQITTPVAPTKKTGWMQRLRTGLSKTRGNLSEGLGRVFLGKKTIDDDLFEEIETQLLMADIGIDTTQTIIDELTRQVSRKTLKDAPALLEALEQQLTQILNPCDQPLTIPSSEAPFVILMVGINGAGKTTTIGKLAKHFHNQNHQVMLAAGDTFRAAAVEQLQVWGERNNIPVVAQHTGADSASVIFDALQSATANKADILIADTAGRLHNKAHLMEELKKVKRVLQKINPDAPHEVMLVLDAGVGQNAIRQTEEFHQAVGVTGITLTKLDGTAKGGVIFALADKFQTPFRYIGVGEGIDDLRPFNAKDFAQALFDKPE